MTYHGPKSVGQFGKTGGTEAASAQVEPTLSRTYSGANCRRIEAPGPEDITIDYQRRIAFVSSQLRRRGGWGAKNPEPGAIFGLTLDDLNREPANLTKELPASLCPPDGAFHPHGISFYRDDQTGKRRLFVINHRRSDPHYKGKERSTVEIFDVLDDRLDHLDTLVDDYHLLSPNDLVATGLDSFYLVNDSGMRVTGLKTLEFFLPFGFAKVVYYGNGEFATVTNGIKGGVGIAVDEACRRLYVSAFSDKKIRVFGIESGKPGVVDPRSKDIVLSMGPDNLEWDDQGNLWVAGDPSPGGAALYMIGLRGQASSMVVRIEAGNPDSPPQPVFSDDGTNISASSVAAYDSKSGRLLIGAPFGDHLLDFELHAK